MDKKWEDVKGEEGVSGGASRGGNPAYVSMEAPPQKDQDAE